MLAQFGGVTLAFAFLATFGLSRASSPSGCRHVGIDLAGEHLAVRADPGLVLVYTYFQIPLMVIVFLPALDGMRPQWREATETLGGCTWHYWRHVAGPILAAVVPRRACCCCSPTPSRAYATAAALVSQGTPIIPLQIGGALTCEVVLGQENVGKAMALGMVVIVAVVMSSTPC